METKGKASIALVVRGVGPGSGDDDFEEVLASFSMSDLRQAAQLDGDALATKELLQQFLPEFTGWLFHTVLEALRSDGRREAPHGPVH
jgi:hypothetical protein